MLAFFGALSISELKAASKVVPSGLVLSLVCLQEAHLLNFIMQSKTEQAGRGKWIHLNTSVSGQGLA